ncbi:DUF1015 domain-containing protein [Kineothrix sp. MB12-C1]|uniref:DUF1015 domain-containing protein n=1 Tax=Kineothrix sp. MB12-C1 TaxID=3070215 RepID=UPI0027D33EC4|nr:DUF1015 family protein [Kineothrix sp. MB12-C1]WMC92504.1 DUF1015 family protein [Kineothrix sp. MB12-C1]
MANVKPFKAIRPANGLEKRIAALPYDVYNREEAKREVEKEPLSFLRIDRAETQFGADVDTYADCVYEKAHELLWNMVANKELIEDTKDCYYVYELLMEGRTQIGIVACASVDDYIHQVIKKHENTREDKEIDRIRHVDACQAQTGPIFLAYRSHPVIREEIERARKTDALYRFTAEDGVTHSAWKVEEKETVERIKNAFAEIDNIYIADGHHRCASAVKVSLKKRQENPNYTGEEEFNYFLSVLFSDDQLMIMDYNRVVMDLNGLDKEKYLQKVEEQFQLTKWGEAPYQPEKKGSFGMYLDDFWYKLEAKEPYDDDPVEALDVTVIQERLLAPVLGIYDPKTEKRIDFVGGIRGLRELERRVRTDAKVAFALYPTSIKELFAVSDAGKLMPPKSTWFEPKLRSGLFIHRI